MKSGGVRSTRSRLAGAATLFAVLLAIGGTGLALTEGWKRSNAERLSNVDLELERVERSLSGVEALELSSDEFVATFDADGLIIYSSPSVDAADLQLYIDDVLELIGIDDTSILIDEYDASSTWKTAIETCPTDACDGVVYGRRAENWSSYVQARLAWLLLVCGAVAVVVWFGSRRLVGGALRPVERMRNELATITETNAPRRIEVPGTGDELAGLAVSMNNAIERLDAAVTAQRRFVSDSAHELRSPLAGIRATLELADSDAARAPQAIRDSITQVDRVGSLIDDLLNLARRDAGIAPPFQVSDIDDILRNEARELSLRRPNVTVLRNRIEPVQSKVYRDGIARVVRNLLDNAATYCNGTIAVSFMVDDGNWLLIVDDDGPGIRPEDRDAVFQRFTRLDSSRSRDTGGTGLGLAIVAGIVADHGGTITLGQATLGGASFQVRVPIRR
ncbi:MAG: HAMP domain-containing histidine kinase [Actinomycetia bacterium]|nr:HAMP domain-containing histidine kinase [Actinomycetes bacterium]